RGTFALLRRLNGVRLCQGARGLRYRAEELGDYGQGLGFIELACDGEERVVRLIILLIEGGEAVDRLIFDIGAVADGELAVVVPGEGGFQRTLEEDTLRTVLAHFKLVVDHGHLGIEK